MRPEDLTDTRKWLRRLETLRGRRATVFLYLFIVFNYWPLKNHYSCKYGDGAASSSSSSEANSIKRVHQTKQRNTIDRTADGRDHSETEARIQPWHWNAFPKIWPSLIWYRVVTTTCMTYVVIKEAFPALLELPLGLLNLSKPIKCYLPGRFLPDAGVRRANACLFAGHHLIWRSSQLFAPCQNYMISTIYFLMLDDRDILKYYKLLAASAGAARTNHHQYRKSNIRVGQKKEEEAGCGDDEKVDQLFHDIMSFRVDRGNGVTYKLRANRTPEACRLLRKHLLNNTLLATAIFVPMALLIAVPMIISILRTSRYIRDYAGCSPPLEQLYEREKHNSSFVFLLGHQTIAMIMDAIENACLWIDSGMASVFSIPLTWTLNYDLIIYWKYLDAKVTRVLKATRGAGGYQVELEMMMRPLPRQSEGYVSRSGEVRSLTRQRTRGHTHCSGSFSQPALEHARSELVYELQMEWQDFIRQIKQADAYIGDCITDFLFIWYSIFAVFIYNWMSFDKASMQISLQLTLVFLMLVVTANCVGLLALHRLCLTSYTRLCSLMAYDRSEYKLNFIQIIDYFVRQRTCFTLLRRYKIRATTYLTIIGWSFSCYFMLGGMRRI